MAKNPKTLSCHCDTVYQVRFVTEATSGIPLTTFISHEITNAIVPNAMNFPEIGLSACEQPLHVLRIFTITVSTVMSVNTVPTVLSAGSHAGTGAVCGTPLQLA